MADDFRGYAALLRKIKQRVLIAQQRAIYVANEEMLRMYWDIGGLLQQSQEADGWGKKDDKESGFSKCEISDFAFG